MAEFQEVLQQWKRMCDVHDQDCDRCPIEGSPCQYIHFGILDLKFNEQKIMQWAAKNPEPQYPSWYEYLTSIYPADWGVIAGKHIPAEVAKKLGIEPKEVR